MQLELRPASADDWPEILRVANEALPQAPDGNAEWLAARERISDNAQRRHYVALAPDDSIVAYGAIERDDADDRRWRLFVVAGVERLPGDVGDALYARLRADLVELGAERMWMREQADDAPLIAFAMARGFAEKQRFTLGGLEIVVLERLL